MNNQTKFSNASLHWDEDNRPHSLLYGDIYFSKADALGESTHVFLNGNQLRERWQNLRERNFVIGELGFGSGLNFLNTCRLWQEVAPATSRLHYVACELHPFTRADMQRLHAEVPELEFYSSKFLPFYPDHTAGVHQIEVVFAGHHVSLTLLYGDAEQMLTSVYKPDGFRADCWFLDGFSPKLNPAMWQPSLLGIIRGLSKVGTTLTTYSVAGALRQHLTDAGFSITKLPGYAQKRHMLFAHITNEKDADAQKQQLQSGWTAQNDKPNMTVCIIGAGLAGCSTAFALAQSGWKVIVLERETSIARQGSGNAQGILHYRPSKADTAERQFNLHAYLYAVRHYQMLAESRGFVWHQCGMLQLAVNEKLLARYEALIQSGEYASQILQLVDAAHATTIAGRLLQLPGLYLPDSGWMSPRALCELYLQHPSIELRTGVEVSALTVSEHGWKIGYRTSHENGDFEIDNVILCNAADAYAHKQIQHYPIVCNLGQVDYYTAEQSTKLATVICGQGYILPSNGEYQSVGGSFFTGDHGSRAIKSRQAEHVRAVQEMDLELGSALAMSTPRDHRIGMRCATPDRMPIVGPATIPERGAKKLLPGLYVNVAHGSHGLTRTPVCAAYLASVLNETPFPISNNIAAVIRPDRF
ncbi:MAG: bifunctional tRNA (5-methylaminomethyl-2-thiouridine)(34)-methyltransferase MnmD/FAD-dependent 5-carboxymethylaminomethyl-2-thiouridine(34) oxidoreductase MnmC [Pseudomonadota bacterium]